MYNKKIARDLNVSIYRVFYLVFKSYYIDKINRIDNTNFLRSFPPTIKKKREDITLSWEKYNLDEIMPRKVTYTYYVEFEKYTTFMDFGEIKVKITPDNILEGDTIDE